MGWFGVKSHSYREKITIQASKIDATLTDKDVYVDLASLDADFWSNVKSDGGDIVITQGNGVTRCAVEIQNFNATLKTGQLWFKANSIASASNTDFYIYYGNATRSQPAKTDSVGYENVWDSHYSMVLHTNEDPGGTAPQILDSTGNHNDGISFNLVTADLIAANIGNGLSLKQTPESHAYWNDVTPFLNPNKGTVSMWSYWRGVAYGMSLFSAHDAWPASGIIEQYEDSGANYFRYGDMANSISYGAYPSTNVWQLEHYTYDNTAGREVFLNGTSKIQSSGAWTAPALTGKFTLGYTAVTTGWNGIMTEVRISDIVRSDAWIKADYENQNAPATFYSIGSQESAPPYKKGITRLTLA